MTSSLPCDAWICKMIDMYWAVLIHLHSIHCMELQIQYKIIASSWVGAVLFFGWLVGWNPRFWHFMHRPKFCWAFLRSWCPTCFTEAWWISDLGGYRRSNCTMVRECVMYFKRSQFWPLEWSILRCDTNSRFDTCIPVPVVVFGILIELGFRICKQTSSGGHGYFSWGAIFTSCNVMEAAASLVLLPATTSKILVYTRLWSPEVYGWHEVIPAILFV